MKIKFSLNHDTFSSVTIGSEQTHYLKHIVSHKQLIDNLIHEDFHCVLALIKEGVSEKKEHNMMKQIEMEWF